MRVFEERKDLGARPTPLASIVRGSISARSVTRPAPADGRSPEVLARRTFLAVVRPGVPVDERRAVTLSAPAPAARAPVLPGCPSARRAL